MNINLSRRAFCIVVLLAFGAASADESDRPVTSTSEQIDFFEKKVRPILVEHCYQCHSTACESVKGNLRSDSRDGVLKRGKSGPVVATGNPDKRLLINAVRYTDKDLRIL